MAKKQLLEISDLIHKPGGDLVPKIVSSLGDFTVALLAITRHNGQDRIELAGTGTLVTLDGNHYVLTANHVWEEKLKRAEEVALTLKPAVTHRFAIERSVFKIFAAPPARGKVKEWGPDIALLQIPNLFVGKISVYKVFLNVRCGLDLKGPVLEIQVLMGTPAVLGTIVGAHAELQITGMFRHGPEATSFRGKYDYEEFEIDLRHPGPREFGGVSGGGLWRVFLYRTDDGKIDWRSILHGVAFYETPIVNEHRTIRCHGARSILRLLEPREVGLLTSSQELSRVGSVTPKRYTTIQAARAAKVSRPTIQYWISSGKIEAAELRIHKGKATRLWTSSDVAKMRQLKATLKPGPDPKGK